MGWTIANTTHPVCGTQQEPLLWLLRRIQALPERNVLEMVPPLLASCSLSLSLSRSPATRRSCLLLYAGGGGVPPGLIQPQQALQVFELLSSAVGPPPPLQRPGTQIPLPPEALCLLAEPEAGGLCPGRFSVREKDSKPTIKGTVSRWFWARLSFGEALTETSCPFFLAAG